jgi:hypothetical protein
LSGEIQNVPPQPIAFGKYTLLERISHGGMAEVFRAKTQGTAGFERIVAIKLLLPQVANDADFVTMLIDEAKIAGQLSHANIAQIFDLGQVDGRYYIVQEYVPGRDLRAILHLLEDRHERLDVALSCHIILKVCEALDYAHNKNDATGQPLNLVHRDISPQNVIVSHEGEVKLIDFGIVKAEGRATRTLAGLVKGKFAYMSPEQIRGLPVDRRADVFACGIILHELLTGQPLFKRGSEFETLQRARSAEIEPPSRLNPEVPPELDRIALRALARHVDDRYKTAVALRDELWQFVRDAGHFHSRDRLAGWMRETFGEPSAADLEAAHSAAALSAMTGVPGMPASLYEDEDGENMTVVDADLHSRLRLAVEDADTVAADADDGLARAIAATQRPAPPALRDLAEVVHRRPVLDAEARERAGRVASGMLQDRSEARGHHDDEETTGARSDPHAAGEPQAGQPAWFEPQTPTKRRIPTPEHSHQPLVEVAHLDLDRPDHGALQDEHSDSAPTFAFKQMDPGLAEALLGPTLDPPPLPLQPGGAMGGGPMGGSMGGPPGGPMGGPMDPTHGSGPFPLPGVGPTHGSGPLPMPMAPPDARTIGPGHHVPVPFRQGPPSPSPAGGFPPAYPMPQFSGPPEFGPPNAPPPMAVADLIQTLPPLHGVQSPFGPHGPQGFPPPGMHQGQPGPAFPGEMMPGVRPASGRFFIAVALAILVAAVIVSIVLAVTGA